MPHHIKRPQLITKQTFIRQFCKKIIKSNLLIINYRKKNIIINIESNYKTIKVPFTLRRSLTVDMLTF